MDLIRYLGGLRFRAALTKVAVGLLAGLFFRGLEQAINMSRRKKAGALDVTGTLTGAHCSIKSNRIRSQKVTLELQLPGFLMRLSAH